MEYDIIGLSGYINKQGHFVATAHLQTDFSEYEKDAGAGRRAVGKKCETLYIGTACREAVEQLRPGMRIAVFFGRTRTFNGKSYQPVEKIDILSKPEK